MQINPTQIEPSDNYKLLTGAVIPRPIGWISSIDNEGNTNLAPFSYFSAVCDNPPCVMFSVGKSNGIIKDTLHNILQTKHFVVNMVTENLVEQMNMTAQNLPQNESEFELANLTAIQSTLIKAPRVKESPINMECELMHQYTIDNEHNGGATIIVGKIIMYHFEDDILLENNKINIEKYKPISRLAGSNYSKMGEVFSIKR